MRFKASLVLAALLLVGGPALAQEPDVGAGVDAEVAPSTPPEPIQGELFLTQQFAVEGEKEGAKERASVGTRLVLTLTVTHPAGTIVALPDSQKSGRFELLGVEREPLPVGVDPIKETIRMTFAVYRPGRHVLEPFELSVLDPAGRISVIKTRAVEVRVESVLADIKDPEMPVVRAPVTVFHEDWTLVWLLSAAGLLVLGALVGSWVSKRLRPPVVVPGPPPRPAYDVAMEKLRAIEQESLIGEQRYEEFYVRVSEAIREYLGRRYNLSLTDQAGLELTTGELVALLNDIHWPRGLGLMTVEAFLYDCDIVKFARYTPSEDECSELLSRGYSMVELTRPVTEIGSVQSGEASEPARVQPEEDKASVKGAAAKDTVDSRTAGAEAVDAVKDEEESADG